MTIMRAEIRCCCDAARLLGTVPIPSDSFIIGTVFRFRLTPVGDSSPMIDDARRPEDILELEMSEYGTTIIYPDADGSYHDQVRRLAIKSNDTPIEKLRRIAGFIEAEKS